jgi:hypothetical protein
MWMVTVADAVAMDPNKVNKARNRILEKRMTSPDATLTRIRF